MDKKIEWHPALEAEMRELAGKINERVEVGADKYKAVHEAFGERIIKEVPVVNNKSQEATSSVLPKYAESISPELRLEVEKIIDELWHDGNISRAISAASKKGSAALDLFHDTVAGKAHGTLKAGGLL